MKTTDHRSLLGLKVRDKVTNFSGVATSITFDLYGCIQAYVVPPQGKDRKIQDGAWFDTSRLAIVSTTPVMAQPSFADDKGGQSLPDPHLSHK